MKQSALARRTTALSAFLFLTIVLWHTCGSIASGQSRYTDAASTSMFSIGVGVAPGIALPIGTLDDDDEPAPGFALRAGLNITYPLSIDLATFLNAGIDMRSVGVREDTLLDPRMTSVQYFYIQPGISYSSLGLSLNVGIPLSGSEPMPRTAGSNVDLDATQDIPSEQLELLLEPRLNGTLVLMDSESYWLGLDISVGLPLNKLYKEEYQRDPEVDLDGRTLVGTTSPFTAHLGLTFQFGLFDAF